MAVMLAKTYDEELAVYENRFAKIEQDFAVLKTDMTAIKWMIGVNLAASISIVVKVFM